jgi:hypothetical protein
VRTAVVEEQAGRRAALEEVRQLVSGDGADFEVGPDFDQSPTVELKLVITDVSCEECVLPRSLLEGIAVSIFQTADDRITGVRVQDPREQEAPQN